MIIGGVEFETTTTVEHLLDDRRCRLDALLQRIDKDDPAYDDALASLYKNDLYWFLPPDDPDFCSCVLFENLMRELIMNSTYPTLPDVMDEHPSANDDAKLLVQQLNEWPDKRGKHIDEGAPRPKYWRLLDMRDPNIIWYRLPTPKKITEDEIRKLLKVEAEFLNALHIVAKRLSVTMEAIDSN